MADSSTVDTEFMPPPWYARRVVWLGVGVLLIGWVLADWLQQRSARHRETNTNVMTSSSGEDLFASAIHQLHRLETFKAEDVTVRIVEHLNQWLAQQQPVEGWRPDPLLATVPTELRVVTGAENLQTMTMPPTDRMYLMEVAWMHYLARHSAGEDIDALERAKRLFDWTIRNIQLEAPQTDVMFPHMPNAILLTGRGSKFERAWVFLLLARQQGLDAAMLAVDGPDPTQPLQPWVPAVLIDGQLYLFESELGIPIPGPGGVGVATLEQAADDPTVLSALGTAEAPYAVTWNQAHRITALIEAAPQALSQRMQIIESRLAGEQRLSLTVDASSLAQRMKACRFVANARIWTLRYDFMRFELVMQRQPTPEHRAYSERENLPFKSRPALIHARVFHNKGLLTSPHGDPNEDSAIRFYQQSRVPDSMLDSIARASTDAQLANVRMSEEQLAAARDQWFSYFHRGLRRARENATYWLGLVAYERGDYQTAIDYLERRVLVDYPETSWKTGAVYNLARCHEALGEYGKAIALYETDESPQRQGNLVRARMLRQQHPDAAPEPPPGPSPTVPEANADGTSSDVAPAVGEPPADAVSPADVELLDSAADSAENSTDSTESVPLDAVEDTAP